MKLTETFKQATTRPGASATRDSDGLLLQKVFLARMGVGQQFRRLFDHIPGTFFFVKDAQSRMIYASQSIVERLGLREGTEVVGRTDYEFFPTQIADNFVRDDQAVLATGQPILNKVEIWYNAQHILDWFVTTKLPVFDEEGRVMGIMGIVQSYAHRRKGYLRNSRLGRVLDYIETHHRESISVADLAKAGGISKRQLLRKFHNEFGMSAQEFVLKTRIHAASEALLQQDVAISEVSEEFAFFDQSAFTRQFRKITGMTPLEFQKRYGSRCLNSSGSNEPPRRHPRCQSGWVGAASGWTGAAVATVG
jgi:AraC-like DNA-binding protein